MVKPSPDKTSPRQSVLRLSDIAITLLCWLYFTLGFVFFFSVAYLAAYLFPAKRENRFQRLTSLFYKNFFRIVRSICPSHHWSIDPRITTISSSVIVCNHLSYLDPLLLISLFARHKTIVKTKFFKVPIFGWLIHNCGYLPADSHGRYARMLLRQMEQMHEFLADGGNLFVFPEGTRSRNGEIGSLNPGALKIARICQAPVVVLRLTGTHRLFQPGRFFFNTQQENTIRLKIVDRIGPNSTRQQSIAQLEERIARALFYGDDCTSCPA